jgi:hypothetical protein
MSEAVTRYYFNVVHASKTIHDFEGTELSSLKDARNEAIEDARLHMSSAVRQGRDVSGRNIQICNEGGDILMIVAFKEALARDD